MISSFGSVLVGIGILTTGICVADEPGKPDPQPLRQYDGSTAEDVSGSIPEQVILDQASYQNALNRLGLKESPRVVERKTASWAKSTLPGLSFNPSLFQAFW